MLLRNYYNLCALYLREPTYEEPSNNYGEGSLLVKSLDGSVHKSIKAATNQSQIYTYQTFPMSNLNYLKYAFIFGGNDTPVTFDDYQMPGAFRLNCQSITYDNNFVYDANTKTWSYIVRLALNNNTSADKTIKEVGIVFGAGNGTSTNIVHGYYCILGYREVLEEPITVPAGKTITYTHEFKFTMPQ